MGLDLRVGMDVGGRDLKVSVGLWSVDDMLQGEGLAMKRGWLGAFEPLESIHA